MRKWAVYLLLLSLSLFGCTKPAEPVQMHLLTEIVVYTDSAAYAKKPMVCRYNENGLLLERLAPLATDRYYYDQEGDLEYWVRSDDRYGVTTHNPDGNVLSVESEGTQRQYTYDERGNLLTDSLTVEGVTQENNRYSYVYNKYGDIERLTLTDIHGQVQQWNYRYTYDEQGRKLTEELLQTDGPSDITNYSYNENGDILMEENISPNGYRETMRCTYDDDGRLLRREYELPAFTHTTEYTYDTRGRQQTMRNLQDGIQLSSGVWTYDDATGHIKDYVYTDHYEEQVHYKYDSGGRLVSITEKKERTEFRYEVVMVPAAFISRVEAEQKTLIDSYLKRNTAIEN